MDILNVNQKLEVTEQYDDGFGASTPKLAHKLNSW